MDTIRYPRDIALELHGALEKLHRGLGRTTTPTRIDSFAPLPTPSEIGALLDASFFASLIEEEGRRTILTLAFIDAEVAGSSQGFKVFRFKKPLPLSPKDLAKIGPAASSARTYLGVWRNEEGHLVVWGLIQKYGYTEFAIDRELRGTCLRVQALRSGIIMVHYLEMPILLFANGHYRLFEEQTPLLRALMLNTPLEEQIARTFSHLARRMLAHGHGGAILIVDTTCNPINLKMHDSYTEQSSSSRFLSEAATDYWMEFDGGVPRGEDGSESKKNLRDIEKAYIDALDFVGRLTAVDGATVLCQDLTLRGFGATINTQAKSSGEHETEILVQDPYSAQEPERKSLSSFAGNRHRSAIQFCASQPDGLAAALVASQDGDFSLFVRRDERTVYALRPYVLGIGIIPGTLP